PSRPTLKPVYCLSRRKLTTPDTASEPYAEEAPPVTISTLLISACGKVLMSTVPLDIEPTERRPSNNTSVRVLPSERRLTELTPARPLLCSRLVVGGVLLPAILGSSLTKSARFAGAAA